MSETPLLLLLAEWKETAGSHAAGWEVLEEGVWDATDPVEEPVRRDSKRRDPVWFQKTQELQ